MNCEKERILGLDFIRASAVLAVVFHHTLCFNHPPAWVRFFGPLGTLGVEALLVLSGYLIGSGLIKKCKQGRFSQPRHLRDFYIKRWLRTLPPYYLFLFVMAALFPPMLHQLFVHREYFFFMQNFAWRTPSFYSQSWTLAILEFFYFLFPLVLFLTTKLFRRRLTCFLIPITLFFVIPITLRALHTQIASPDDFEQTFRKWVVYRFDTPIAGVILALVQAELPHVWNWLLRNSWLGLTAVAASAAYYLLGCPFLYSSHWLQVFIFPIISVTIALAFPLLCNWKDRPSLFSAAVKTVSQVSYSLYVSHYFALSIGVAILMMLGIPRDEWLIAYPLFAALIVLCVYPTYRLAEEPFMRLREMTTPPPSLSLAFARSLGHSLQVHLLDPLSHVFHHKPTHLAGR